MSAVDRIRRQVARQVERAPNPLGTLLVLSPGEAEALCDLADTVRAAEGTYPVVGSGDEARVEVPLDVFRAMYDALNRLYGEEQ